MAILSGSYEERETIFRCSRCNETYVPHPVDICTFCRRGWRAYCSRQGGEGAYLSKVLVAWSLWARQSPR